MVLDTASTLTYAVDSTCNCILPSEREDQELSHDLKYIKIGPLLRKLEGNTYQHHPKAYPKLFDVYILRGGGYIWWGVPVPYNTV